MRPWLDPLGEIAQVVFVDVRGTGRSERPSSFGGVNHDVWIEDIDAVRVALGHEHIALFGHSYGGFLAQEYALRHRDRLRCLILCATAPAMDYHEVIMASAQKRATADQLEAVSTAFAGPLASDAALKDVWLSLLPLYFEKLSAETRDLFAAVEYNVDAFNHGYFECLPTCDLTEPLTRLAVPALVLGGRHDWIVPPAQGPERLHSLLTCSELTLFEESGHFPFIEEQEQFIARVGGWLEQHGLEA